MGNTKLILVIKLLFNGGFPVNPFHQTRFNYINLKGAMEGIPLIRNCVIGIITILTECGY